MVLKAVLPELRLWSLTAVVVSPKLLTFIYFRRQKNVLSPSIRESYKLLMLSFVVATKVEFFCIRQSFTLASHDSDYRHHYLLVVDFGVESRL